MKELKLLGLKVCDKVTGFEGVVTTVGFDLFGCIQVLVTPVAKDGAVAESRWMDTNRVLPLTDTPCMEVPPFVAGVPEKGPQEKSVPRGL